MTIRRLSWVPLCLALFAETVSTSLSQNLGNAWHIPDNTSDLGGTSMRNPRFEIGTNTTVTIHNGNQFQGAGNPGDQTGGTLFYKGAAATNWNSAALVFDRQNSNNKYWRASFDTAPFGPNEVIQYYLQIRYNDHDTTYLYGRDSGSSRTNSQTVAASSPFSIRDRSAFLFHGHNRVVNGPNVEFWTKAGYIGKDDSPGSRWADHGAVYYTVDGSPPAGSLGVGANGSTGVVPLNFDHRENDPSIAGNAMWWVGTATNLPLLTTIRYRIGLWHNFNNEEKFADYNTSGTNNATFTFSLGTPGEPLLTVNGVSANYTTTHLFVDEVTGTSSPLSIVFQPNAGSVVAAEVFSNLNHRDRAQLDADGDGIEDGILPPDGVLITTNTPGHYYSAYAMPSVAAGRYVLTLNATQCGAYRLTARYKVAGNSNWIWYTTSGRRDHAIVVSPRKARDMVMYELNTLNVEATGTQESQRSTFVDLWDGPGATLLSRWNLDYVKNLGVNWLWFQPIHPAGIDGRQIDPATGQPFEIGSPYAVKNFFEVMPQMSKANTRASALVEFTNFVAAADAAGMNVMLDAAFNHTAYDCELAERGTNYFGGASPTAEFRNVEARFYSLAGDYCNRASSSGNIAVAPDRGDFGKFVDTHDVFFGRYAALVCQNPGDNGNHLNEGDWFDTTTATGHFDTITRNVWRYFADYLLFWLDRTGCPTGTAASQSHRGVDGLRADFAQGLPPQAWEYIINKTRTRKWDFVFMAESLDGGAVTYRSGRHFDVLNENILFALKGAGTGGDYKTIYEQRRQAYGQAPVLLNTSSHDEENYNDPWEALIRYACNGAIDGVPMIFHGQELGISTTFGFDRYELNFGKTIPHFKKYNSMSPIWLNTDFGLDQLYPVYAAINRGRLSSQALRSSSRHFLGGKGGPANPKIFATAKFNSNETVLAFVNLDRNNAQSGTFDLDVTEPQGAQTPANLFGILPSHVYNARNLAAYTAQDGSRSNQFLWPEARLGSQLIQQGIFVSLNPVPSTIPAWNTAPYEAQFLRLIDVAPPPVPAAPYTDKPYVLTNRVMFHWPPVTDTNYGTAGYQLGVGTVPGSTNVFFGSVGNVTNFTVTGAFGQTLFAFVRSLNAAGRASANSPDSSPVRLLLPAGDEDGDGMTNFVEDFAGTDPLDAGSLLRIISLSGGDRLLIWTSVPGRNYRVLATTNVTAPFSVLSGVIGSGGATTSYTDSGAPSLRKYYRVEVLP